MKQPDSTDPLTDTGKHRRAAAIKNSMTRSYLISIVVMTMVAIGGVALITYLRPESDLVIVMAAVFGLIAPTTVSLLAFLKAQETHLSVNSRLDEFIRSETRAARSVGVQEGRELADARTDELQKNKVDAPADVVPVKIVETTGAVPVEIVKKGAP